ncbi:hypothetical protein FGO68_gene767 [Halteria grandinella]|uniref:Major facilitator superfamily (MFS) profile domain-containing protein n=1 Tax=Halteria grandinella TaxID=5974 RepID=A0A8J8T3J4_HALGN|nr:hypothetical protein FGO68_gene767 [Halteria grandinella]
MVTPDIEDRENHQGCQLFDVQSALQKVGGFGTFQILSTSILISGFCTGSFLAYAISFLELNPKYYCIDPKKGTEYECTRDDFCGTNIKYRIDWNDHTSLYNWVETLDLTCTPKEQIGLIGSMLFAGWAFAAVWLPRLADVFGRRTVYLYSMIGHFVFFGAIILSHSRVLTTVLMFLLGMSSVGRATVGYLYMMELSPLKQQTTIGTLLQIFNTFVTIFACFFFYYISKQWQWFEIIGLVINLIVIVCVVFMPESPKYLYAQRRWDDMRKNLNVIAKLNKAPAFKGLFDKEVNPAVGEDQKLNGTISDLVKIRRHLINLVILVAVWIASSFNFYLINFQLKYIQGDVFVNTLVSAISELPATILAGYLYQKIGIKITLVMMFGVAIIGSISLLSLGDNHVGLIPVFILLAKSGVSATFNICYLANAQIFPAIFSGTAFGICNIGAKLATILAPLMAEVNPPAPMIIFTCTAALAALLSLSIITKPDEKKGDKSVDESLLTPGQTSQNK